MMLQHCPLRQPFLKEDRALAGRGHGEESPAWRACTGAGVPLGTDQRTRASPGCSEMWKSPSTQCPTAPPRPDLGRAWLRGWHPCCCLFQGPDVLPLSPVGPWWSPSQAALRCPSPPTQQWQSPEPVSSQPVRFLVPHLIMTGPAPKSSKMD